MLHISFKGEEMIGRRVRMFRCHIDPMVGKKPANAFVPKDLDMEAFITDMGVNVKVNYSGREHLIPWSNIQSTELEPDLKTASDRKTKGHV